MKIKCNIDKSLKLIGIIMLIFFFSCTEEVDNKYLPQTKPKIVLHSYISPSDSFISVRLTKSKPVFAQLATQETIEISNASVKISNTQDLSKQYSLIYNSDSGLYFLSSSVLPIISGNSYKLDVETFSGEKVNAITNIPNTVINPIQLISIDSINYEYSKKIRIKFQFSDIANQENYYLITPIVANYTTEVWMNEFGTYDTLNNVYEYVPQMLVGDEYVMDNQKDGEIFTYEIEFEKWDSYNSSSNEYKFFVKVSNISKDYFYYGSNMNVGGDMDFFSEPVTQYTNINGGIGVFAGYNSVKYEIKLKN